MALRPMVTRLEAAPELAAPEIDWRWCAEIDPFACAVLAERFPAVRNLAALKQLIERQVPKPAKPEPNRLK